MEVRSPGMEAHGRPASRWIPDLLFRCHVPVPRSARQPTAHLARSRGAGRRGRVCPTLHFQRNRSRAHRRPTAWPWRTVGHSSGTDLRGRNTVAPDRADRAQCPRRSHVHHRPSVQPSTALEMPTIGMASLGMIPTFWTPAMASHRCRARPPRPVSRWTQGGLFSPGMAAPGQAPRMLTAPTMWFLCPVHRRRSALPSTARAMP
jgi:hypothetical protein